jgi:hypothetical protein
VRKNQQRNSRHLARKRNRRAGQYRRLLNRYKAEILRSLRQQASRKLAIWARMRALGWGA